MVGRFPLYTDADIHGPLVDALSRGGWDIVRAVDAFSEGTDDAIHFERAAQLGRVMVSNDRDVRRLRLLGSGKGDRFALVAWEQELWSQMTVGDVVERFEAWTAIENPFAGYPILYLKPQPERREEG